MRLLGEPNGAWGYLGKETGSDTEVADSESNVILPDTSSTLTVE